MIGHKDMAPYTYQRLYARQLRTLRRAIADQPLAQKVRAAFDVHGILTIMQLRRILGPSVTRNAVAYHLRCLVARGVLLRSLDNGRAGDGSRWRYTLCVPVGQTR